MSLVKLRPAMHEVLAAGLSLSANLQIADATVEYIAWDTVEHDTGGFLDLAGNPTRITIPAGVSYVFLSGGLSFENGVTGSIIARFEKNGAGVPAGGPSFRIPAGSGTRWIAISSFFAVSEGDYFELMAFHNTGSAQDVEAVNETFFKVFALA